MGENDCKEINYVQKVQEMKKVNGQQKIFMQLCEKSNLPVPIPEYKFHDKRKWRIDYYFEYNGKRIALEVEGGVWTKGRHTRGSGFTKDMVKDNEMAANGILLLRVTPTDLMKLQTIDLIKKTIYG